jgi:hypothetical protein
MASSTVTAAADSPRQPIAPWWHTVLVASAMAGLSLASWYQHGPPNVGVPGISSRLSTYFTVIVAEWSVILLIWLGLRRRGDTMQALLSPRWPAPRAFFRDLGLAAGFFVLIALALSPLAERLAGDTKNMKVAYFPQTALELAAWLAMSATAGFCEEFIFRGYLMRQFSAWTRSRAWGIVLQAVAFGLAHGYYNKGVMVIIGIEGVALGLFTNWRKSLRPGMLAHGLQDSIGGIVAFFS